MTIISFFGKYLDFWIQRQFLAKIQIFDYNFVFWKIFRFLNTTSILAKIQIFDYNFDLWIQRRFLAKMPDFLVNIFRFLSQKFYFLAKISSMNFEYELKISVFSNSDFFQTISILFDHFFCIKCRFLVKNRANFYRIRQILKLSCEAVAKWKQDLDSKVSTFFDY